MKLLDSFYHIEQSEPTASGIRYTVALHPDHVIYQAHFPGKPITPGVCIIQIARELLSLFRGEALEISILHNVKFLSVIEPGVTPVVNYEIGKLVANEEEHTLKAQVTVTAPDDAILSKISFTCKNRS